jgi:hypothetical protein
VYELEGLKARVKIKLIGVETLMLTRWFSDCVMCAHEID